MIYKKIISFILLFVSFTVIVFSGYQCSQQEIDIAPEETASEDETSAASKDSQPQFDNGPEVDNTELRSSSEDTACPGVTYKKSGEEIWCNRYFKNRYR